MRRLMILAGALALAACDLQLPGLTGLDRDLDRARTVVDVRCNDPVMSAGQHSQCFAINADSAVIRSDGRQFVRWGTTRINIVQIDLDGVVSAPGALGVAVITAYGAGESSASDSITVQ